LSAQACGVTKGRGEMGFSDADQAEENDVGFVFDKLETEEVLVFRVTLWEETEITLRAEVVRKFPLED